MASDPSTLDYMLFYYCKSRRYLPFLIAMIHAHDVNQSVAELVRNARSNAGMTQADLAAKAGMSRASLANIEVGIQSISVYQLLCLANALGVEPAHLLPTIKFATADDPESLRLLAAYEAVLSAR